MDHEEVWERQGSMSRSKSAGGVLVVDGAGVVREAQPEAAAVLGRKHDELVGQGLGLPIRPGTHEMDIVTSTGPRTVEMSANETRLESERFFIVSIREVTSIADQVSRLESEVRTLRTALSAASHEIRSPVAVVLIGAQTLSMRWDELTDAERLEGLQRIERQAKYLARVSRRILGGLDMEPGALIPEPESIDLAGFLYTKLADMQASPDELSVSCPPGVRALADPEHVWEMLANYIENAFKYAGPPVEIEVRDSGSELVTVCVCDRGPGIPVDYVDAVFTPFRRGPDAETRAVGTGLGLSLVRQLAQANGGDAWYEPRPEGGASFCVSLPRPA